MNGRRSPPNPGKEFPPQISNTRPQADWLVNRLQQRFRVAPELVEQFAAGLSDDVHADLVAAAERGDAGALDESLRQLDHDHADLIDAARAGDDRRVAELLKRITQ